MSRTAAVAMRAVAGASRHPHPALALGFLLLGGLLMAGLAGAVPLPQERRLGLALPLRAGGEVVVEAGWFARRCVALDLVVRNRGPWPLELEPASVVLMRGNEVGLRLAAPTAREALAFPARRESRAVLLFAGGGRGTGGAGGGDLILRLGPEVPPLLVAAASTVPAAAAAAAPAVAAAGRAAPTFPWPDRAPGGGDELARLAAALC